LSNSSFSFIRFASSPIKINFVIVLSVLWFGHVEHKDDYDWIKRCMMWEVEGIRQRGRLKKTW